MSENSDSPVFKDGTKVSGFGTRPTTFRCLWLIHPYITFQQCLETYEQLKSRDHEEESGKQEMTYGHGGISHFMGIWRNAVAELEGGYHDLSFSLGLTQ